MCGLRLRRQPTTPTSIRCSARSPTSTGWSPRRIGAACSVILDLVPNHSSDQHPWFVERRASRTSRSATGTSGAIRQPDGGPPNNWVSELRRRRRGRSTRPTGQYYLPLVPGRAARPQLAQPAEVAAMRGRDATSGCDRGVDGFPRRRHPQDDQGRSVPRQSTPPDDDDRIRSRDYFGQQHVWDQDRPEVHEIIRGWRRLLDRHGERTMVGEST